MAPIIFLVYPKLIAVLPPTVASTIANKVVGIYVTFSNPLIYIEHAKPQISRSNPPPFITI